MKKLRLVQITLLFLMLFSFFSAVNAKNVTSNLNIEVYVEDAYYADLPQDDDSYEDDVFVLLRFDLGKSVTYDFEYKITLTLPSGTSYEYNVFVSAINTDTVYTNNYFWDHATEQGMYNVNVQVLQVVPVPSYDETSHEFDPPGGSTNSDPTFGAS